MAGLLECGERSALKRRLTYVLEGDGMVHMCRRSSGFTLVEILIALVVVSMGITILVSLFTSSLSLAQSSRNQRVAASLAEEEMRALQQNPGAYEWGLESVAPGQFAKVEAQGKPADGYPVEPPSVLPAERAASARESNLYDGFSWKAFAKLPVVDAPYVEVTVTIQWTESGRERLFALTSSISRASVTRGAPPPLPGASGAATPARAEGST